MATLNISTTLDVASKFALLVQQALAETAPYLTAKQTIQDLVDAGAIDSTDSVPLIGQIVSSITNAATSSAMSTALGWAEAELSGQLKKTELEYQVDILLKDKLLREAQEAKVYTELGAIRAESKRMFGTSSIDATDGTIVQTDTGKVYEDILLTRQQVLKITEETSLVEQKINESYAVTHKLVADAAVNYGAHTYTLSSSGAVTTSGTVSGTLSEAQKRIAVEQAKGYTYNAWANALTGSASMLGTAIAAEYVDFSANSTGANLLSTVNSAASKLVNATTET